MGDNKALRGADESVKGGAEKNPAMKARPQCLLNRINTAA